MGRAGQEDGEGMKAEEPEQKRPVSQRSQGAVGSLTTVGAGRKSSFPGDSPEAPAATSSCRSRDRGMPFCGERHHKPVVLGTKPSLGHTCFRHETLNGLVMENLTRRGSPSEPMFRNKQCPKPAVHSDLLLEQQSQERVPWLTPCQQSKDPGFFHNHSSHMASHRPSMDGWLFVVAKEMYRVFGMCA